MNIKITLRKNSSFNNEEHFIHCLQDLITEWEDIIGPKEMDTEDVGFNCERLKELKSMLIP
tara:strand:- start:343 stop:525 length:183 start_codon:yes stop_codon:yes gene_type:complete